MPSNDSQPSPSRCPKCGGANAKAPSMTWWGGAVGPKLLSHVVCQGCGAGFNRKTGKSNTPAIIVYQAMTLLFVLALAHYLGVF